MLLETATPQGARPATAHEVRPRLGEVPHEVMVCAHTHLPRALQLPGGPLVLTPGSVGLPAYADDLPHPHVMQVDTPHERYALLSRVRAGWQIEHLAVPYEWEDAARLAQVEGRVDRAG